MLAVVALGFALAVTSWIHETRVIKALEQEATSPAPSLGIALDAGVERLDALLLRLQLTGDAAHRDAFLQESGAWAERLGDARAESGIDPIRQEHLRDATAALASYAAFAGEWLSRGRPSLRRDTTSQLAAEIDNASTPLRAAATALIAFEQGTEASRQARLSSTLTAIPMRLAVVAVLLLSVAGLAATLVWRGIVLPLRAALRERIPSDRHRDRLAELGSVAAGVVHEIRTPLTAIKARTHQLRRLTPDGHPDLIVIENEIRRLDRILEDFLQFASPSVPRREPVSVITLLGGIQDLVHQPLGERGITLHLEQPPALVLDADPAQLRQVLLNLVRNAADSLTSGGVVTLRARTGMETRSTPASPVVMLEVADTGSGIAPEVESRLFEPFVSAKPQGTGLGLSIAARLVEAHGGHIQYQTRSGLGTVFTIVLPRAAAAPMPSLNPSSPTGSRP